MTPAGSRGRPARSGGRRAGVPAARANESKKKAGTSGRAAPGRRDDDAVREQRAAAAALAALGAFRLGAVPGATPGKWIDTWKERMPRNPLELLPLDGRGQRDALVSGEVDAAIVRLPIERDGLSVIALYDETTVAVCSVESSLTVADELRLADLAGEVVIVPADDVVGVAVPDAVAPGFATLATTADAVATVATGVGVTLMPMSLARLHHRKDVEYRPVVDAPTSAVVLAWPTSATTPLVETFIGIVRGRTANSSR